MYIFEYLYYIYCTAQEVYEGLLYVERLDYSAMELNVNTLIVAHFLSRGEKIVLQIEGLFLEINANEVESEDSTLLS